MVAITRGYTIIWVYLLHAKISAAVLCFCDTIKYGEIFFLIDFLHRENHSFYRYRRNEFISIILSIQKSRRIYNRFIYDTYISSEIMGCQKVFFLGNVIILSMSYNNLSMPKLWLWKRKRLPIFQFIQLLILEEITIFLTRGCSKGSVFQSSQFYLNNMKYHQELIIFLQGASAIFKNSDAIIVFRIYLYLAFFCQVPSQLLWLENKLRNSITFLDSN